MAELGFEYGSPDLTGCAFNHPEILCVRITIWEWRKLSGWHPLRSKNIPAPHLRSRLHLEPRLDAQSRTPGGCQGRVLIFSPDTSWGTLCSGWEGQTSADKAGMLSDLWSILGNCLGRCGNLFISVLFKLACPSLYTVVTSFKSSSLSLVVLCPG